MQTTEELKRAMYGAMEHLRACVRTDRVPYVSFPAFEERLESTLRPFALIRPRQRRASKPLSLWQRRQYAFLGRQQIPIG